MRKFVVVFLASGLVMVGLTSCFSFGGPPNWQAVPTYGSVSLDAGFLPDPHRVSVTAGGSYDLSFVGESGYVAQAPDYDLYYSAGGHGLYIYVESQGGDTVLLVRDPGGDWYYSDDAAGTRPGLAFSNPRSGLYDIWVGTYGGGLVSATLAISEIGW